MVPTKPLEGFTKFRWPTNIISYQAHQRTERCLQSQKQQASTDLYR